MSAKSPSPINNIHRAGWGKTARTKRDSHQIKTLGELMKVPPGKVRVWSRVRGRGWRFVEHEDVTIAEARELAGDDVGEYIPKNGLPMLLGRDARKMAAVRESGFLVDPEPANRGGRNESHVGLSNFARLAT